MQNIKTSIIQLIKWTSFALGVVAGLIGWGLVFTGYYLINWTQKHD